MKANRFRRGSGCFECKVCGKRTRDTGDNASCEMCPLCFERSSWRNSLSDHGLLTPEVEAKLDSLKTVREIEAYGSSLIQF